MAYECKYHAILFPGTISVRKKFILYRSYAVDF